MTDEEIVTALEAKTAEAAAVPPNEPTEPTIADRFVGMANLIVDVRTKTRLSEATLVKLMETALQYHAWDTARVAQESQNNFDPRTLMGNGDGSEEALVGPEGEYLGETETPTDNGDNTVHVDFTPKTTEEV